MCGRYALGLRATFIRHRLRENGMPVDDAPEDDEVRESYNFAPGYNGLVYRADTPPSGADVHQRAHAVGGNNQRESDEVVSDADEDVEKETKRSAADTPYEVKYKLQAMKWGLIPFWTKRDPGYGSLMKTINARDDSLASKGGMWNTMKKTKRCIILAQGFYEWLKKDGGKTKIPHFVKRKDGKLMCFAGLWDCVQYEGREDRLWTYTIITTDPNKQLGFLHDRMPVILDNGSDDIKTWLDTGRTEWTQELQSLLKPYSGELEIYPVNQAVGKVGNNSPDFIVPLDSSENKSNIANFFGNAKVKSPKRDAKQETSNHESKIIKEEEQSTSDVARSEDNAPMPTAPAAASTKKREAEFEADYKPSKQVKLEDTAAEVIKESKTTPLKASSTRKLRSATSNGSATKTSKDKGQVSTGSQKITSFFSK